MEPFSSQPALRLKLGSERGAVLLPLHLAGGLGLRLSLAGTGGLAVCLHEIVGVLLRHLLRAPLGVHEARCHAGFLLLVPLVLEGGVVVLWVRPLMEQKLAAERRAALLNLNLSFSVSVRGQGGGRQDEREKLAPESHAHARDVTLLY